MKKKSRPKFYEEILTCCTNFEMIIQIFELRVSNSWLNISGNEHTQQQNCWIKTGKYWNETSYQKHECQFEPFTEYC